MKRFSGSLDTSPAQVLLLPVWNSNWDSAIQTTVFEVAITFGFQLYNKHPKPETLEPGESVFVPATYAVASEHLLRQVRDNFFRTSKNLASNPSGPEKVFEDLKDAIADLHEEMFTPFQRWEKHVQLPSAGDANLQVAQLWIGQLAELAMMFLLYTEASSLRHTPELMWLIYWVMQHSRRYMEVLTHLLESNGRASRRPMMWINMAMSVEDREWWRELGGSLTAVRKELRNRTYIAEPLRTMGQIILHQGRDLRAYRVLNEEGQYRALIQAVKGEIRQAKAKAGQSQVLGVLSELEKLDDWISDDDDGLLLSLLAEVAILDDGSLFLDRVVQPFFTYLVQQVFEMGHEGIESAKRVAYDDVNESCTVPEAVHIALTQIEVLEPGRGKKKLNQKKCAFDCLLNTGTKENLVDKERSPAQLEEDAGHKAEFWGTNLFQKTFMERRTPFMAYRAFLRVYVFLAVYFHLLLAIAFSERSDSNEMLMGVTTISITHCSMMLISETIGLYVIQPLSTKLPSVAKGMTETTASVKIHQYWGEMRRRGLSFLVWFLTLLLLVTALVNNNMEFVPSLKQGWWYVGWGYIYVVLVFETLRHTVAGFSLSSLGEILLGRSSADKYMAPRSNLTTSQAHYLPNNFMWLCVFAIKIPLDYFWIIRPLEPFYDRIIRQQWYVYTYSRCLNRTDKGCSGFSFDWLLAVIMMAPSFLTVLYDTGIIYQVVSAAFGTAYGLLWQHLGAVRRWDGVVASFLKAPRKWSAKCVSREGLTSIMHQLGSEDTFVQVEKAEGRRPGQPEVRTFGGQRARARSFRSTSFNINTMARAVPQSTITEAMTELCKMKKYSPKELQYVATQLAFLEPWNELVQDMRSRDLLSDAELSALLYERLSGNVLDINEKDKASASPAKPSVSAPVPESAAPPRRQQSRRRDGLGTVAEEEIQPLADSSQKSSQKTSQKTSQSQPISAQGATSVMFAFTRILGNKNNNRPAKPEPVPDVDDIGSGVSVELFPYLLPKMIAAGQVYEVLRTFAPSQNQMMIMWESYQWLLWLLARTGLINEGQLKSLRDDNLRLPSRVKTTNQEKDRQTMLGDVVSLLESLPTEKQFDDYAKLIASRKESGGTAVQALLENAGFKTHAKAIRDKAQKLLDGSVKELSTHKKSDDRHGKARGNALTTLKDLERVISGEDEMIQRIAASITFIVQLKGKGPATYCKVIKWLVDTLTKAEGDAVPENKEAQRILYFFLTSLHNPLMPKARPLHETKSLTTLTPHYAETVMHGLDAYDAERMLQPLGFPKSKQDDDKTFLFDRDGKPTGTLRYLHTVYAQDWKNFCERMKRLAQQQGLDYPQFVSEFDFLHGNRLYPLRHQLLMWACLRGQPLARTVRGMMAYRQALECMAKVEYARPEGVSLEEFHAQIEELVDSKFNYCVTSQILGSLIAEKKDLTKRWTARGLEALMMMFPKLQVSYVDSQKDSNGRNIQWSVLLQPGEPLNPDAPNFALENVPKKPTEVYRVRLPINYKSPRGVVLGEGKPENQNHAIIFCFGECIQTIDMNQDNVFAEALKMRNLLAEFVDKKSPGPVALVGFREWIISQDCGALADFAASTELTFGSLVQRVMTVPSAVRFHYGHPDVWNKRFIMYRGGVSKANKSLHVSEDVFGGYNCTLRGGLIKFSEYISVGKGRDMGFDSINGFEAKISAGNGEQVLSRDVYRLGSIMDFFRLMSWYHTGNGFFINTALTMFSVKVACYSAAVMALTGIIGSDGVTLRLAGMQIVQLGSFSILVYAFTVGLDKGITSTLGDILGQMVSGSLFFFIFRAQTSAANFVNTLRYGGAAYVATGRGFLLTTLPYEQIWRLFGRTHMYFGMELALLLILANVVRAASFVYLLPSWVVVLALLLGPFWFNPFAFETKKVKTEFHRWMNWMNKNGSLKDDNCWRVWHKKDLARARNDGLQQTDRFWLCLWMLVGTAPTVILALAAVNDARSSNEGKPGFHPTRWQLFAFVSIPVYTMAAILLTLDYYYIKTGMRTWMRYLRFFVVCFTIVFFSLGIVYLMGDNQRVKNFYILLYAMLQLLQALKIILLFGFSGSSLCRMFVDRLFYATDITIGVVLFGVRWLLSLLGIVNRIQGTLLFNTAYARQYVFEQDMKGTELEAIVVEARRRTKQQ